MNDYGMEKKLGGDKVAILGLFVVALLAARFLVASRHVILLSEPILLTHAGLALSMPAGNGWQSENQWTYQDDIFTLSSFFGIDPQRITAGAGCQYRLTAQTDTTERRFEHQAFEIGGIVVEKGRVQVDSITIDWAQIDNPQIPLRIILGFARLPGDRQLDIAVYQTAGDDELAKRVFERIVNSLQFEEQQVPIQDVI
jgi:hypothetical protein